jgi:hypothetical protein
MLVAVSEHQGRRPSRRNRWWADRDSNAGQAIGSKGDNPREKKPDPPSKPSEGADRIVSEPSVETLRAKLDAAIVAEAWDAVEAIRERIVQAEREADGVVQLSTRRRGRR